MAFFKGDISSSELGMHTGIQVIIPDGVVNAETPVVYLLHGLSDNCSNWVRLTSVERYANRHGVAIVIPEVQRSFYSDMKYGLNYYSYISKELIQIVHSFFGLPTTKDKTFIAGLSMGGFGALKCGMSNPKQYAAVASFSAVCDIQDLLDQDMTSANCGELYAILGDGLVVGDENNLYKIADKCKDVRVLMTCGTLDILHEQNLALKTHMEDIGMDITYREWDGDHTWEFWDSSIEMALEYFFGKGMGGTKTPLSDGKMSE